LKAFKEQKSKIVRFKDKTTKKNVESLNNSVMITKLPARIELNTESEILKENLPSDIIKPIPKYIKSNNQCSIDFNSKYRSSLKRLEKVGANNNMHCWRYKFSKSFKQFCPISNKNNEEDFYDHDLNEFNQKIEGYFSEPDEIEHSLKKYQMFENNLYSTNNYGHSLNRSMPSLAINNHNNPYFGGLRITKSLRENTFENSMPSKLPRLVCERIYSENTNRNMNEFYDCHMRTSCGDFGQHRILRTSHRQKFINKF
jgi:hypothetical protein